MATRTYQPKFEGKTTRATVTAMTGNVIRVRFSKRKIYSNPTPPNFPGAMRRRALV